MTPRMNRCLCTLLRLLLRRRQRLLLAPTSRLYMAICGNTVDSNKSGPLKSSESLPTSTTSVAPPETVSQSSAPKALFTDPARDADQRTMELGLAQIHAMRVESELLAANVVNETPEPTGATNVSISLASIANALTVVAAALPSAITAAEDIYKFGATMIVDAETAYSTTTGTGATKKAAVLAAVEAFVVALGQDFSKIEADLSAWIDMVLSAYNKAAAALTTASTVSTATAVSDAAAAVGTAVTTIATPVASTSSTTADAAAAV